MEKIEQMIGDLVSRAPLPGLAAAVLRDGQLIWSKGFGRTRGPRDAEVDERTRFPIASCTKSFTAMAIKLLADRGALDWDQPVKDMLPGFRMHDPAATRDLSVRDLLAHHSGLPPHTWSWIYPGCDRAAFVHERLPHLESVGPFRECYRYSNITYLVAGQVVEARSGMCWEDFVRAEMLEPLDMPRTGFLGEGWPDIEDMAAPHRAGEIIAPFHAAAHHPIAPAGEMDSCVEDLAHWLAHHLEDVTAQALFEPQVLMADERPAPELGPLWYALGWRSECFRRRRHVWHTGSCSGYSSLIALGPDDGIGLVLLCNADAVNRWLRAIGFSILDALFGDEARDWPAVMEAKHPEPAPALPEPTGRASLEGRYRNSGYGSLSFEPADEQTSVSFNGQACGYLAESTHGVPVLVLSEYGNVYPIRIVDGDTLEIAFEPQLDAIRFSK